MLKGRGYHLPNKQSVPRNNKNPDSFQGFQYRFHTDYGLYFTNSLVIKGLQNNSITNKKNGCMQLVRDLFIKIMLTTLALLAYQASSGQGNEYSITGTVKDSQTGEPLEMANVALLNPVDSSVVTGNITDSTGHFVLEAPAGTYNLHVRFVSYKNKTLSDITLGTSNPRVNVGTVQLSSQQQNLEQVVVEGEQSHMTMEGGKKVFNVGTDLSTSGASASEVLENIPAVSVDIEGNISLRGSQGVRILVNGKPSSMMGLSGTEALRYFPAYKIKQVEVITNPSAQYEAQGTAGIINIILKEEQNWGLNGTFNVEAGMPRDHGISANMNYRKKWYNVFASYQFNIDRSPGDGWREQTFHYPDTTYSLRTENDDRREGLNHDFRFGSDFYFTPNDVLKVSGVYRTANEDNHSDLTFLNYRADNFQRGQLASRSIRDELEEEKEGDYELNLNYEKTFGKEDHQLTADFQARQSIEVEDASLVETNGLPNTPQDTTLFQNSLNDTEVGALMGKIDYTWPFSEDGEFQAGFRGEVREIDNAYNVEQRPSPEDPWNTLDQFSNTFHYEEKIYGAYAMYNNKRGAFSYQAGLRLEYTSISTRLETDPKANKRSYFDLFPSLSVSYDINKQNSIQASYSRRLDRPYFRELNPYNTFNNDRNYRTGNPNLNPEFTGAYDLGYVYNKKRTSFYVGSFYRRTVNEIENVDTVNTRGITISKPFNLASRDNFGIEARYSTEIYDWWNINLSSYFYRGSTSGSGFGEDLNSSTYTMDASLRLEFDVRDWFEMQINGDYRAPEDEGQDRERAMYGINIGLRKKILSDKGNLSLSIRDVFNTQRYRSHTIGNNFTADQMFRWREGPVFSLSFSYSLKDRNAKRQESSILGNGDEQR